MAAQSEADGSIVGDDAFPFRGSPQQRSGLESGLMQRIAQGGLERQWPFRSRNLPESQVPIAAQRGECARRGEGLEVSPIERGASRQIPYARERLLPASLDETIRAASGKRFDQSQTQSQRRLTIFPSFQRAIPHADANIDRPHLDPMGPRVPHELRRRVESHWLTVEQCRRERRRLVTFEPGGVIRQESKAGGM